MFRLFDRTRRIVCRATFIGLCILPTVGITAWGVSRHLPGHTQSQSRWLTQQIGLRVTCQEVEHLTPDRMRWAGLQLADPETGQTLFACASVDATVTGGPGDAVAVDLVVRQPRLDREGLRTLAALLDRTMRRQTAGRSIDLTVRADEVQLDNAGELVRMTACGGTLKSHPAGSQAQLQFQLGNGPGAEPAHIELVRNRQTDPPSTAVKIYTGSGTLPCRLLAVGLPPLGQLGPAAQFRGYLWASETGRGWSGELSGQLTSLSMGHLIDDHFNHSLQAQAEVTVEAARFSHGRHEEAVGTLVTGPGTISRGLLEAAVTELKLVQSGEEQGVSGEGRGVRKADEFIPFQQLGVAWRIGPEGLRLQGRCPVAGPGTIMIDRRRALLGEPVAQPQPIAALIRTLVPATGEQVPAGDQTEWLLRRLPATRAADGAGAVGGMAFRGFPESDLGDR